MQLNPAKSRSIKYSERKAVEVFSIQGANIPAIQEQGIRCLGKHYDMTLKDGSNLKDTMANLTFLLKAIDNNQLLGRFKVWCFQYGTIPRLQWPFLLYDFAMTQVEAMDRFCVTKALSLINMYIRASELCLPISSVVEQFKDTKTIAVSTLLL